MTFKPVSIALLLFSLTIPVQAAFGLEDSVVNQIHNQDMLQQGISPHSKLDFDDHFELQLAEGYLSDSQYEKALTVLDKLLAKYPNNVSVGKVKASVLIELKRFKEARLLLADLRKQVDQDQETDLAFALLALHVQSYLDDHNPEHAFKIFRFSELKPKLLTSYNREEYDLLRANLLYQNNQSDLAMQQMMELAKRNPFAAQEMDRKGGYHPEKAKNVFEQAEKAYNQQDYERALALSLVARQLDPFMVAYSTLVTNANREVQRQLAERFRVALPQVRFHVGKMRYALDLGDYHGLYREYLRFKADEDIAFVMKPVYRDYLPTQMYRVVATVEKTLRNEGFDF